MDKKKKGRSHTYTLNMLSISGFGNAVLYQRCILVSNTLYISLGKNRDDGRLGGFFFLFFFFETFAKASYPAQMQLDKNILL